MQTFNVHLEEKRNKQLARNICWVCVGANAYLIAKISQNHIKIKRSFTFLHFQDVRAAIAGEKQKAREMKATE